ncbi:ammonium transporter [Salinisphaera hydrothermalis]|uniref:Ammonium transporter n=1 Tax=Salinisphaera hydrothermalis (strain C41B8) TaxID=1304275 RepID=A0A084IL51_SALHC|nr:ammonium transporter [Salinisphaera hydrothermalis]KEZ77435.1 ammonium transporter [Salinisphaera hydrothermalis C41B8]
MSKRRILNSAGFGLAALAAPGLALAQASTPTLSAGNTAWMLTATALVLFMTIPGLALFYGGMVRAKNSLSVLMQCFAICCLVTLIWALWGYSVAFGGSGTIWGGLSKAFMAGVGVDSLSGTIPETVFSTFQLTFAIITPALIVGAFVERMKFSAMLWFIGLWVTLVYTPIAHWVWGGGFLGGLGVQDFAGGTVVHINAGVAGLVAALMLGKRSGYPKTMMRPHNLGYTLMGASMLWVGWFGFNAGSELAADGTAGMAMFVTQLATAVAALTWMFLEWGSHGKPSVLGICSGAVAGLVAITPASGFVGPMGSIAVGVGGGFFAFYAVTLLKGKLGYDDSLDAFGVHGVAGIVGALLTGIFSAKSLGGAGLSANAGGSIVTQFGIQAAGVAVTIVYCAIVTAIILGVLKAVLGLRVDAESEEAGLDLSLHDERAYDL